REIDLAPDVVYQSTERATAILIFLRPCVERLILVDRLDATESFRGCIKKARRQVNGPPTYTIFFWIGRGYWAMSQRLSDMTKNLEGLVWILGGLSHDTKDEFATDTVITPDVKSSKDIDAESSNVLGAWAVFHTVKNFPGENSYAIRMCTCEPPKGHSKQSLKYPTTRLLPSHVLDYLPHYFR